MWRRRGLRPHVHLGVITRVGIRFDTNLQNIGLVPKGESVIPIIGVIQVVGVIKILEIHAGECN
jgi:hypothetical protein